MGTRLEHWCDERGAYVLGRLGARVAYARLEGTISSELARRFGERFGACLGDAGGVTYFADWGDVVSYDLSAAKALMRTVLAHRHRLERMLARPWSGPLTRQAADFAAAFGPCEYVGAVELEARLLAAAPSAAAEMQLVRSALRRAATWCVAAPPRTAPGSYAYVFDLSNFERGRFVATRFEQISRRPSGCWVCVAPDDDRALSLAQQAAHSEWSRPRSRAPEEFTVQFVDPDRRLQRSAGG